MRVGDWVVVRSGPIIGQLLAISPSGRRRIYCVSWPDDPYEVGHWWVVGARPATPEELAAHQLASGQGDQL